MAVYRVSLIKQGWHVPLMFESELRNDSAASQEVSAFQSVYTLGSELPCQVEFEPRRTPDPRVAQGRWGIVDWSVAGEGAPELLPLRWPSGADGVGLNGLHLLCCIRASISGTSASPSMTMPGGAGAR